MIGSTLMNDVMQLYPSIDPYKIDNLDVSGNHCLYIEQSGNPKGIPVIFLHGGPGAGTDAIYRRFFNPDIYRIILFDQRGSGKSTPYGDVGNNTTQDLIEDIKAILLKLNIKKTIIYGGSWGSTLGLLFAESYPELVSALVLRGIFLCRLSDIKWFYQHGAHEIFPDYWGEFIADIPLSEREDILTAFHKRIHSKDKKISSLFCQKWAEWEGKSSSLLPSNNIINQFSQCSESLSKIETHYFINNCFIDENEILININKIQDIKCEIVHGRYDIVCPFKQAFDLHNVYPASNLNIIDNAGHSLLEPGIQNKILEIFDKPNELT